MTNVNGINEHDTVLKLIDPTNKDDDNVPGTSQKTNAERYVNS